MEVNDIPYKYFIKSFSELIYTGLDEGDDRLLRGIQTLDISTFSHLEGIESILSVMFALTVDGMIEAIDLEHRLIEDRKHYEELGTLEKMEDRLKRKKNGEIPFFFIKNACSGLKNVVKNIFLLKEEGYIEIIGEELENSFLKLSPIWKQFIDYTIKHGSESDIYGSSISRMIASAILQKGFRLLNPIISTLLISDKNGGKIQIDKLKNLFEERNLKFRHFSNVIERDQKKPKDIKLIHHKGEKRIIFNTASIYTVKQWLNLAEKLKLEEERKLK